MPSRILNKVKVFWLIAVDHVIPSAKRAHHCYDNCKKETEMSPTLQQLQKLARSSVSPCILNAIEVVPIVLVRIHVAKAVPECF